MVIETSIPPAQPVLAPSGEFWTDERLTASPDNERQHYELWDGE